MKTLTRHLLSTRALAVAGVTALLASAATPAHAILLTATQDLPNLSGDYNLESDAYLGNNKINLFTGNTTGANGNLSNPSVNQVDLGVFTFTGYSNTDLASLVGLQISIELGNFNTADQNGDPNAGPYSNKEFLTIDGVNTGIALNGFQNTDDVETVTGISNAAAATQILGYLNGTSGNYVSHTLVYTAAAGTGDYASTNAENTATQKNASGFTRNTSEPAFGTFTASSGQLVVGILNTAASTNLSTTGASQSPDAFYLAGGSASLAIADYIIPFHPAQALGFALIALCIGLWYLPQTRNHVRKLLAPAA